MVTKRNFMTEKIRLIATDMDGTFLDASGQFDHQRLDNLLKKFEAKNLIFTIASGRSLLTLEKLFKDFTDRIAIIAENGSLIQYKNQVLFEQLMTPSQYLDLTAKILENPYNQGVKLLLSGKKAAYILAESPQSYIDFMKGYYENIQLVENFEQLDDAIFKITTQFPAEYVHKGAAWLNERLPHIQAVTTGFESIDIILRGANKGFGLSHLCQVLKLKSEHVLAFGDNLNDFEMMDFADVAIAPENARVEIKELADEVIPHHQEQSVITYMEGMIKE